MTHPLRVQLHRSGRAKSHSFMYFRMCARALVRYRALASALEGLDQMDPQYDLIADEIEEAIVEPVVFAGMCLEATLYDLSACLCGDSFAEAIDKLDPLGKYYALAQYVDRKPPNLGGPTAQSLQAVITARNKLVHHKSQSALEFE